jgi:murein DD-endopeptidase MepM/ murein hydrolase activator NlpD
MKWFSLLLIILFIGSSLITAPSAAQGEVSTGPVYVVQPGDTLWDIAQRFRVSVDDMVRANGLVDAGQISVGDQLLIPGLEGVTGRLVTVRVPYGESLRSMSRQFQTPINTLVRLNSLTSPLELHTGFNLIVPEAGIETGLGGRWSLGMGESLLEAAVRFNLSPYLLAKHNALNGTWEALPGDTFRHPGDGDQGPGAFPMQVSDIEVTPTIFTQGRTAVVRLAAEEPLTLDGSFAGRQLSFFSEEGGLFYALQGVHAMLSPGVYPLTVRAGLEDGTTFEFSQMVYVRSGGYPQAPDLIVDEAGLDPALTLPEDERWTALAEPVTSSRRWDGLFEFPSPRIYLGQYTARFGERRTYNNSTELYYHTGLDIPGQTGTEVYAPAYGEVIFTGNLEVRGNSMMIDHGWGVYSAYMHLSEFKVQVGDQVESGQLIALVGNTGLRTTGSHLHWEMLVGGVQVDPLEWMEQVFP